LFAWREELILRQQLFFHHPYSLTPFFLLQDITHDKSSGDVPQDVGDQSQLSIIEAPESSSAENSIAQTRVTSSVVEVIL
jgi:hypothetical protein